MSQTILIVEDEPGIDDTVTYALSTEGFTVQWCSTGKEALSLLQESHFDLIILDIGLPDCNGFDLYKQIQLLVSVPVIFLTARSDEIDKVVGLELGADDYVVKPFGPRELAARVKAVLRRASTKPVSTHASPRPLFVIDNKRKQIIYADTPLDLSRYEYRILEVLIGKPGWVFSRDQLMDLAWEEPEASFDRTVDTHIKTLRAKLRKVRPDSTPLQTHRGLGYSLKETL